MLKTITTLSSNGICEYGLGQQLQHSVVKGYESQDDYLNLF
jgi:hypothetical protein